MDKTKKSSYQKLKDKNKSLTDDIMSLIGENGFENQLMAQTKWRLIIDTDKQIWFGSINKQNQ